MTTDLTDLNDVIKPLGLEIKASADPLLFNLHGTNHTLITKYRPQPLAEVKALVTSILKDREKQRVYCLNEAARAFKITTQEMQQRAKIHASGRVKL